MMTRYRFVIGILKNKMKTGNRQSGIRGQRSEEWLIKFFTVFQRKITRHFCDLGELLIIIAETLKEILEVDLSLLILIDQKGEEVFLRYGDKRQPLCAHAGQGILGIVLDTGQPLLIEDICKRKDLLGKYKKEMDGSFLLFPLKTKEGVLGVIYLHNKDKYPPFNPGHLEAVSWVAPIITYLIIEAKNRRLKEDKSQTESLTRQTEKLKGDIDQFKTEVEGLRDELKATKDLDGLRERLEGRIETLRRELEELGLRIKEAEHFIAQAEEVEELTLQLERLRRERDELKSRLQEAEGLLAQVEEKIDLQEKLEEMNILYRISREIISISGVEEVLTWALERLQPYFEYHLGAYLILDEGTLKGQVVSSSPVSENCCAHLQHKLIEDWSLLRGEEKAKPLFQLKVKDLTNDESSIHSWLTVPLTDRGTITGLLNISSFEVDSFDAGDERLFSLIAGHISEAIEKDRSVTAEHKKLKKQLRRSEHLASLASLAAGVAHEIRNPVGAIRNSIGLLKRDLRLDGEDKRLMEIVIEESERLDGIITDFLGFARPKKPLFSEVYLKDIWDEVITLLEKDDRWNDKIKISKEYQSLPTLFADPDQMRQVSWNLLLNAVQAMPEGGTIEVRLVNRPQEKMVEAVLSDTGYGMSKEVLDKVFEPFWTTKSQGTGLGLPIVHRIIEGHNGLIDIESREGKGTTIKINLPV